MKQKLLSVASHGIVASGSTLVDPRFGVLEPAPYYKEIDGANTNVDDHHAGQHKVGLISERPGEVPGHRG